MATPLLLVVHGRTGGVIPEVYRQLARELEQRRQAPVGLRALTAPEPGDEPAMGGPGLTLVPLLLLPGNHARVDVPALAQLLRATAGADLLAAGEGLAPAVAGAEQGAGGGLGAGASPASAAMAGHDAPGVVGEPGAALRPGSGLGFSVNPAGSAVVAGSAALGVGCHHGSGARGAEAVAAACRNHGVGLEAVPAPAPGVRRLPFLGAWPAWQSALAAELAALADAAASAGRVKAPPLLLHHPLEGGLALRYLAHLQRRLGCRCLAAPYSSQVSEELALAIDGPVLPLALAANRLTERLEPLLGSLQAAPLLERPRLRQLLLEQLAALP